MRKEWRRKKREEAANNANKEYAAAAAEGAGSQAPSDAYSSSWQRPSGHATPDGAPMYPSGPQYSAPSMPHMGMDAPDPFGHRGSANSFLSSAPAWSGSDTRPTTANTVSSAGSPSDGRFAYSVPQWASNGYDRKGSLPGMQTQSGGGQQPPANFHPYMMTQKGMI